MLHHFLSPTKTIKKHVRLMAFLGGTFALADIAVIETFRWLTTSLENNTFDIFLRAIGALALIELIDLAFHRRFKNKDRTAVFAIDKQIYELGLRSYITLEHTYAEKMGLGRLQSIYQKGLSTRTRLIYRFYLEGSKVAISISGALIILLKTNIRIALGALCILSSILSIFWWRNKKERRYRNEAKKKEIEVNKIVVMQMMSKFEILQSDRTNHELDKYNMHADELSSIHTKKGIYNFMAYHAVFSIFNFLQIAVFGISGYLVFQGLISLPDFFIITLSFRLMGSILGNIRDQLREYSKEIVHLEKLRDIMDSGPKLTGIDTGTIFMPSKQDIIIHDMTFSYDTEHLIFEKFSCTIAGGKKTALVGISGSGKSTLIKLLAGYLRPTAGTISIGNQSLEDISLKSYYQHVGYLTQEPLIFDGTIRENLTYALPLDASHEELDGTLKKKIDTAITAAKCEFIYDFPQGIHTEIGERGIRLSGGQKQRLAIAKIFIKNPSIILLDEPTSALDSFSEDAITQAMQTLFEGRTVIIIAHRLQTVKQADTILVFDEGEIIESGNHTELVAGGGAYASMLELQSGF